MEIIRGVEETLERAALSMVLTTTHDEELRHRRWMARKIEHGTDGVILVLPDEHAAHVEELRRHAGWGKLRGVSRNAARSEACGGGAMSLGV